MVIFYALVINIITLFTLYTCVNNGNKSDTLFFKGRNILLKVRESLLINGKVLKVVHIVNVKVNCVKWNVSILITLNNSVNLLLVWVTPSALLIAECPHWR